MKNGNDITRRTFLAGVASTTLCGCVATVCEENASLSGESATTASETIYDSSAAKDGPLTSYAVSSSSDAATEVGMSVLAAGGNAVDAAVAVAWALTVAEPWSCGIAGGGATLIYDRSTGKAVSYDYRAAAPTTTSVSNNIAVPGFTQGMEAILEDYGTMSLAETMAPAIELAEDGVPVTSMTVNRLTNYAGYLSSCSWAHDEDGNLLSKDDTMYQSAFAKILGRIAENGSQEMLTGETAESICDRCSLTQADLTAYEVKRREAVHGTFEGMDVYGCGAPYGGASIVQMLEMAEALDLASPEKSASPYLKQIKQISLAAMSDRVSNITDPDFVEVDEEEMCSTSHILELLGLDEDEYGDVDADSESSDTTAYAVAAGDLVVVATNTLSSFCGSKVCVDGAFFLNNACANFTNGVNTYKAGKRPRSFTAPIIVVSDDGFILACATPGGCTIPVTLFFVLTNILKFDLEPQEAVDELRVIYCKGNHYIETEDNQTWFNTAVVTSAIYKPSSYWWGSMSIAGIDADGTAFGAYDTRRGATYVGVLNE